MIYCFFYTWLSSYFLFTGGDTFPGETFVVTSLNFALSLEISF